MGRNDAKQYLKPSNPIKKILNYFYADTRHLPEIKKRGSECLDFTDPKRIKQKYFLTLIIFK